MPQTEHIQTCLLSINALKSLRILVQSFTTKDNKRMKELFNHLLHIFNVCGILVSSKKEISLQVKGLQKTQ